MSQAAPIWATATPLSFALRLQKTRLLRQAAPLARLLLSTRFGRDTGPDVATDAAKAGLRPARCDFPAPRQEHNAFGSARGRCGRKAPAPVLSALCRFFPLMTAEGCAGPKAGLSAVQSAQHSASERAVPIRPSDTRWGSDRR